MKGKKWNVWGMLCAALLWGIVSAAPEAQALDTNRIYEVTPEEQFVFDAENGLITDYQAVTATADLTDAAETTASEDTGDEADTAIVVIPQTIQGIAVKGLDGALQGHEEIQKVILPDTVERFGDDTFQGCTNLTAICVYQTEEIYQETQVTEKQQQDGSLGYVPVGDASETGYYEITDEGNCAVIPASLQTVGIRAFNDCAIGGFDVLEGSESFRDSDEGGTNLPDGVGACLLSLDGTKLYRMAPRFRDQNNSLQYSMPEGIVEILPYAGQALGWQQVEVANTVRTVDRYAFYQSGLLGISFAEVSQAEDIGEWAFAYNDNLDIVLPASVKTIGAYCFAYMVNRTPDISQTQITVIPEYTFAGCTNLHTITMPATLQSIGNYAFAGNANLNEVVFTGQTLSSIGIGAFQDCTNMHRIDIPSGVTVIEENTFSGCTNLNEVVLPEGLTDIQDGAFANCQNIHSMVIPATVIRIASTSFSGANTKDIDTSKNALAANLLQGTTVTTTPVVRGVGYQQKVGNLVYRVTKAPNAGGTGAVTVIGPSVKSVKKVVIPASVSLGNYRYQVTAIAAKAFVNCKKLRQVTIGSQVTSIGKKAFRHCKKLKKITITTKKLTKSSVGAGAFQGIHKKAVIRVPKKKWKAYRKILRKKGVGKKMKIKK